MRDPKGKPGCLRETVASVPIRPKCSKGRARSAKDGSGTAGASVGGPACLRVDGEDIIGSLQYRIPGRATAERNASCGRQQTQMTRQSLLRGNLPALVTVHKLMKP